ncbi:response regulator [Sphingomonas sp.]|uniref:response regulator n=1 Tax=Sphingomonas sp. TaxID=28214 RepID=UPI0025FAF811|nr:response regulator [Sphingomonas sp.]MBV9528982.1 response regulator [Sphingomonas sp.]
MAKILVIDDDPFVRTTIRRILVRAGYDLWVAENGDQGLECFKRDRPDLVITDIIMPEREGIEVIRAIRAIDPAARIIAISGGGRIGAADVLAFAAKFGAREVIGKPFEPSELTDSVARCLGPAA